MSTDYAYWEAEHGRLVEALKSGPRWHRETSGPAALQGLLRPRPTPPVDESRRLPSYYLDPARRIVDYVPPPELTDLQDWCERDEAATVRLVHGPGGSGKTRLAIELGELLAAEPDTDWLVGHVVNRPTGDLTALSAALRDADTSVLVCVDYAEDWAYELPKLLAKLPSARRRRVRVLLLARTVGAWWRTLTGHPDVGHLVDDQPTELAGGPTALSAQDMLVQAYRNFHTVVFSRQPSTVPPVLESVTMDPDDILGLHAAALSVVLHEQEHRRPPASIDSRGALDAVLGHERRWWGRWLRAHSATLEPENVSFGDLVDRLLAVPALFLAGDVRQAERALKESFEPVDIDDSMVTQLATVLPEVYPTTVSYRYYEPLRPDRLGEAVVLSIATAVASAEQMTDVACRSLAATATIQQALHALLVLARASGLSSPTVDAPTPAQARTLLCIRSLLVKYPETFLPAACVVVAGMAQPTAMVQIILAGIGSTPRPAARLAAEHLPVAQDSLAPLEVALWQRYLESFDDTMGTPDLAYGNDCLGWAHERAGDADAALAASRLAAEHYAQAVAAGHHHLLGSLAHARATWAERANEAGLTEESLNQITRAIDSYEELYGSGDEHYLRSLFWAEAFRIRLKTTKPTMQDLDKLLEHRRLLYKELGDFTTSNAPNTLIEKTLDKLNVSSLDLKSPSTEPLLSGVESILVPVGHSVGPLFTPRGTSEGMADSYEIRFADGIFSIDHEELRVWTYTHGDPETLAEDPPRRDRVYREVSEMEPEKIDSIIDRLIAVGLLAEVALIPEKMQDFAYKHQIEPLALGLGNSPEAPWYFQIGLPATPRVMVGHDAYHLWMFAHRHASLWDAVEYVVADRRKEAVLRSGPETDPHRVLENFIRAMPVLISTSCAYLDRVR
ncbi:hypothetical protein [Amycolatopsis sp. cmx-4-54]|uniref:hypothetical protein n=1 Tax=Amycolatopsis sp. cmx-4-54 TaxID=2790936 RepID=UPI00397944C9